MVKITYEYMNFYYLWLIHCSVHSIIQKEDPKNKNISIYTYKLYIKRNDELEWFKYTSFEEIEKFRNYIIKYVKEIKDIPFPTKSVLSYIPFIGKIYGDDNNDVLIEKKYILDNFFEEVCNNIQVYKLDEFDKFFTES